MNRDAALVFVDVVIEGALHAALECVRTNPSRTLLLTRALSLVAVGEYLCAELETAAQEQAGGCEACAADIARIRNALPRFATAARAAVRCAGARNESSPVSEDDIEEVRVFLAALDMQQSAPAAHLH